MTTKLPRDGLDTFANDDIFAMLQQKRSALSIHLEKVRQAIKRPPLKPEGREDT